MAQIQYIKHLYEVEEKSLSEIARLTEKNFRTVQKYAYCDDWSEESLPDLEPKSYPVLGNYLFIIDKWLEEDRKVPRKQRHTAQRIFDRLVKEHGFRGSYSLGAPAGAPIVQRWASEKCSKNAVPGPDLYTPAAIILMRAGLPLHFSGTFRCIFLLTNTKEEAPKHFLIKI